MAQLLSVRLLGQFQLGANGAGVSDRANRSARIQALVGYLVLHRGTPVARSHLAFLLWPDSNESQALTNLRNLVHQLRASLPEPDRYLHADSRNVGWIAESPAFVDVAEFEDRVMLAAQSFASGANTGAIGTLREAAEIYRGDLLPSCYADWAESHRDRLRQLFLEGTDRLVRLLVADGDPSGAIQYAQRLVRYDPLHEDGYRHLLDLYAATGDRVAARRVYQSCVAALEQELGVEPSPSTLLAYERSQTAPPPEAPRVVRAAPARRVPLVLSSFVGRQSELEAIARCLAAGQLLTLTGAGGAGKTRLALQVAGRLAAARGQGAVADGRLDDRADRFAGRIWWVDLAPVSEATFVGPAFLNALGITRAGEPSDAAAIAAHFTDGPALLVVDNCEHVIDACAGLVADALALSGELTVVATSREPLGVPGETVLAIKPLPLPPRDWLRSAHPEQMPDALALFAERAAQALPTFVLDDTNSAAVAAICRQVDGLPLAIELAAAAVRVLRVEEIAERIEAQMDLPGRLRGGPGRHRTLRDAIEWSYARLPAAEQDLFRQMSVFAGAFDLPALEAVCESASKRDLLDLLAALVDKSLVVVEERAGRTQYRLLDSLRVFARAELAADGSSDEVRDRHARWCLLVVETDHPTINRPAEAEWLNRVEVVEDDIRAALRWTAATTERAETLARIATKMVRYWNVRERLSEARKWIDAVLARGDAVSPSVRATALREAGGFATNMGDYARCETLLAEARDIYHDLGDAAGQASVLIAMSGLASNRSDYAEARLLATECLATYRALESRAGTAAALTKVGYLEFVQGNYAAAHAAYDEALGLRREIGQVWMTADVMGHMAELALAEGEYGRAVELAAEIEPICEQLGDAFGPVEMRLLRARVALAREDLTAAPPLVAGAMRAAHDLDDPYLVGQAELASAGLDAALGDLPAARLHLERAVHSFLEIDDAPGVCDCVELAAHMSILSGTPAAGAGLYATSATWRRHVGATPYANVAAQRVRDLQEARSALGETTFDAATKAGEAMPLTAAAAAIQTEFLPC